MTDEPRRDPERPYPPNVRRDSICDICGKAEHECRRIGPGVSGHTFDPRKKLTDREDPNPRPPLPRPERPKRIGSPLSRPEPPEEVGL